MAIAVQTIQVMKISAENGGVMANRRKYRQPKESAIKASAINRENRNNGAA
jgi:hypothetical protein